MLFTSFLNHVDIKTNVLKFWIYLFMQRFFKYFYLLHYSCVFSSIHTLMHSQTSLTQLLPKACIAHELPSILDPFWGQCLLHIFDTLRVVRMMMMMMMMMMMKFFCGMEPLQETSPPRISDTPQAGFEICAEPEIRLSCTKLWSGDNHYTTAPQMGHTKGYLVVKTFWLGVQFGTFCCKLGGLVSVVKSIFTGFLIKFAQISSVEASKLHYS